MRLSCTARASKRNAPRGTHTTPLRSGSQRRASLPATARATRAHAASPYLATIQDAPLTQRADPLSPAPQSNPQPISDPASAPSTPLPDSDADAHYFELHDSVAFWQSTRFAHPLSESASDAAPQGAAALADAQRMVQSILDRGLLVSPLQDGGQSLAYWTYHIARSAFFVGQAAAGYLAGGAFRDALGGGIITKMMATMMPAPILAVYAQDYAAIKAGDCKLPWDMTTPGHRQMNPFFVMGQFTDFVQDAARIFCEKSAPNGESKLPYLPSNLYPDYYQHDFHFQTDGWFSSASAKRWDTAHEAIFAGRGDSYARCTLVPMRRHLPQTTGKGLRMLEVGAGTGRFATFVRDNFPDAHLTVSDLSPYYLQEAVESMKYWDSMQRTRNSGSASFAQCAAERLPFEDGSMDVVYSIYLLHELPPAVRAAALAEFARVLRPGGLLVITDAGQAADTDQGASPLSAPDGFKDLNEPYFDGYANGFRFGPALLSVGLEPQMKLRSCMTKTVSAVKRA